MRGDARGRRPALWIALVILLPINVIGFTYYTSSMSERVRSPLHSWLRPSGYLGQSLGVLAFVLFLFLYLYPLRKRFRALAFTGALSKWLDVHITAGLLLPFLGAMHASWRFQGLVGLGYASLLVAALSGIVGKYLYARIPRGQSGLQLSLEEIEARRGDLLERIAHATGLDRNAVEALLHAPERPARGNGVVASLGAMIAGDVRRFRAVRGLRRWLRERGRADRISGKTLRGVTRLARREIALTQQLRMLDATQRVFAYWHVIHKPFSATAFVAVTVHVVVVVTLGVTWFW